MDILCIHRGNLLLTIYRIFPPALPTRMCFVHRLWQRFTMALELQRREGAEGAEGCSDTTFPTKLQLSTPFAKVWAEMMFAFSPTMVFMPVDSSKHSSKHFSRS